MFEKLKLVLNETRATLNLIDTLESFEFKYFFLFRWHLICKKIQSENNNSIYIMAIDINLYIKS